MAGIDGVDPTGQSRDSWLAPGLSLRPGQLVQGVLEAVKEGLALRVGSSLLSIVGGAMVGAKAGQRAAGEVVQSDHGLQLRLLPLQTPAAGSSLTAPPPPVTQAMSPVLLGILESLGNVSAAPRLRNCSLPVFPNQRRPCGCCYPSF